MVNCEWELPDARDGIFYGWYSAQVCPQGIYFGVGENGHWRHERTEGAAVGAFTKSYGVGELGFRPFPDAGFGVGGAGNRLP